MTTKFSLFALAAGLYVLGTGISPSNADIVASFTNFTHTNGATTVAADSSAGTFWSTSALIDRATGTGLDGQSNLNSANRTAGEGVTENISFLQFSLDREKPSDSNTVGSADVGESTWLEFDVTANAGSLLDFNGQTLTGRTLRRATNGTAGVNWTLSFSTDGGTSWNGLGIVRADPFTNGGGRTIETYRDLEFDLSAIGQTRTVKFVLDPSSVGDLDRNINDAAIGVGNIQVNATRVAAVPEPSSGLILFACIGLATAAIRKRS